MTIRATLYSFRRCPYAMRARMGLHSARINLELREIELKNKPSEMLAVSPKGTVPVLIMHNGTVIDESLDIMQWALTQNDPDKWLDHNTEETAFLINRNDNEFKNALDRYKYPNRYPDEDCTGARQTCENTLTDLNKRLTKNKYLQSNRITLADIALFPFVRQCAHVDKIWFDELPVPALQKWLAAHLNSELFKAIMIKHETWTKD